MEGKWLVQSVLVFFVAEAADLYLVILGGLYGVKHAFALCHGALLLREQRDLSIQWW